MKNIFTLYDGSAPEGLVFDLDGTLLDSMPAHELAWQDALRSVGISMADGELAQYGGRPSWVIAQLMLEKHAVDANVQELVDRKTTSFLSRLGEARLIEPVVEIARVARGKLPMAVASGGLRDVVVKSLQAFEILDWFDVVVSSQDVSQGKPHPETFLRAAELLGVSANRCVAFEDAGPGIESAKAAGMYVVDVRTM